MTTEVQASQTNQPKASVLIVEDNALMAELLAEKIRHKGYESVQAFNGSQALEDIAKATPVLVAIDFPLGGSMSGLDLLKKIRETFPKEKLPVVGLYNVSDEEGVKAGLEAGLTAYFLKPTSTTDEIVIQIQEILHGNFTPQSQEALRKTIPAEVAEEQDPTKLKIKIPDQKKADPNDKNPDDLKKKIEAALTENEAEVSIIQLVDDLMEYSFLVRSSDIHLEPFEGQFLARLRVDGILHDSFLMPKGLQPGVITRIKVLAGMRTDEHQAAQDGRFKMNLAESKRKFDVRVSIVPTYFGENGVLRLLAEQTQISTLDDLALTPFSKAKIRSAIKKPHGMILATGPTGSGKSTTLYTVLRELNKREVSIITIEDPIEYSIEGIDQIQVNARTGLTFANGLRSILRQDPNVIMVGEIRDEETASIAVNAALTGHKMLSTLHTNDAATTLPRLLDMGVEPFLVASTINVAIGQRLVRVLCQHCKEKHRLTEAEFTSLAEIIPPDILKDNHEFYFPKGCEYCGTTGYYDRMGIYEILEINDFIRDAIIRRADAGEIKKIAVKNGMITLLEDGFRKALAGYTTIEEILRVVHE